MITKQEMQELINQQAKVYRVIGQWVQEINLDDRYWATDNLLNEEGSEDFKYQYPLVDFYKTQKEANWGTRFKNVYKVDTLNLPTWEEMNAKNDKDKSYIFYNNGTRYVLYINNVKGKYKTMIWAYKEDQDWEVFRETATEESYERACELCVKLFKGEL